MTKKKKPEDKLKAGRPNINLDSLDKKWKDLVLELMGEGGSKSEVMAMLKISTDLYYRWMDEEPEFYETIKEGSRLSQAKWEQVAREGAFGTNPDINPTMMIFNLKNRFPDDWRDKREHEIGGNGKPLQIQEIVFNPLATDD